MAACLSAIIGRVLPLWNIMVQLCSLLLRGHSPGPQHKLQV